MAKRKFIYTFFQQFKVLCKMYPCWINTLPSWVCHLKCFVKDIRHLQIIYSRTIKVYIVWQYSMITLTLTSLFVSTYILAGLRPELCDMRSTEQSWWPAEASCPVQTTTPPLTILPMLVFKDTTWKIHQHQLRIWWQLKVVFHKFSTCLCREPFSEELLE